MAKPKERLLQVFAVTLMLAGLSQGNLPASYAQSISEAKQKTYFIQGAVKKPGAYRIDVSPSVLTLLALAGGLSYSHGAAAFIIRRVPHQSKNQNSAFKIISVRIDELLKGKLDEAANLEPGDIVNIPATDVFFVAGEGMSSGSFQFIEGVTLMRAISRARGVTSGAKPRSAVIFRQSTITGERREIRFDLDDLESGKQKDVPLIPNDVIVVTTDRTVFEFRDTPPIHNFRTCRGSGPCMA